MILVETIAPNVVSFHSSILYSISLPYSLPAHRINLSMHVFMHQSINVNAHGIIVPAALHCAAALAHISTQAPRGNAREPGCMIGRAWPRREVVQKNRTFFFLVAGVGSKYVGKVQNGRHCSDHSARWGAALGTCVSRSVQEGHASSKGKGPMDPWSGCCMYGTQNWR